MQNSFSFNGIQDESEKTKMDLSKLIFDYETTNTIDEGIANFNKTCGQTDVVSIAR